MMPPMKATGTKTAMMVKRGGHDRQADLRRGFARRREVIRARVHVAHDVFAHHDGVVDQQPDGQRQTHQRQDVQREVRARRMTMNVLMTETGSARPVITVLRQLFRKRKTISTVSDAAQQQGGLDVLDRLADEGRIVHHLAQPDVRRQFRVELRRPPR